MPSRLGILALLALLAAAPAAHAKCAPPEPDPLTGEVHEEVSMWLATEEGLKVETELTVHLDTWSLVLRVTEPGIQTLTVPEGHELKVVFVGGDSFTWTLPAEVKGVQEPGDDSVVTTWTFEVALTDEQADKVGGLPLAGWITEIDGRRLRSTVKNGKGLAKKVGCLRGL